MLKDAGEVPMSRKYVKLPVEIEAIQFTGTNAAEIREWAGLAVEVEGRMLTIWSMEGPVTCAPSGWVLKGVHGEIYCVAHNVFAATYREAGVA